MHPNQRGGARMAKDPAILRKRFLGYIEKHWVFNNHHLKDVPCVYILMSLDCLNNTRDIAYIGSTTKLFSRYKSHKIPNKIYEARNWSLLFYLPMDRGFYDYEIIFP